MSDTDAFELHPVLARDTHRVATFELCELLLMNDARFAWTILVPRLPGLEHLHEIPQRHRGRLYDEIDRVSRRVLALPGVEKLNVAALGNIVRQLHVHVVGRHPGDAAWPGPVWGHGVPEPYTAAAAAALLRRLA